MGGLGLDVDDERVHSPIQHPFIVVITDSVVILVKERSLASLLEDPTTTSRAESGTRLRAKRTVFLRQCSSLAGSVELKPA